eukprot:2796054-Alexandrium_andersonii.AAC.1
MSERSCGCKYVRGSLMRVRAGISTTMPTTAPALLPSASASVTTRLRFGPHRGALTLCDAHT